jgi:hypothetical protein
MKRGLWLIVLMIGSASFAVGQGQPPKTNGSSSDATPPPAIAITAETTPADLAKAAFLSMGGEKFRSVQNMLLRGSVNLYPPNAVSSIPGGFSIVTTSDKLRMEIDARPVIVFKQIYNGQQSFSSMPGVELPPHTRFGWGVLIKYDQPGYKVTAIADKKKQRAFRIEDPDGYTTDFYIDATNGRVVSFLTYYGGYTFGTEIKKFKEVEGVLVPFSFSQRFEMPQGAFFAEFSVKEAKLNQTLAEDAFAIPN